jgi:tRNA G10  N-methylase Trm11
MSFYKKTGFWPKFRVKLTKEGKTLNLSEPLDYLEYLVLLADRRVAPNWNAKYDSGEYKFALVDEEETIKDNVNKSDINKKAYKYLGKIEDSVEDMTMVIRLASNKIVKSKDVEFLQSEVQKIIDSNIKGFVEVMEDKSFGTKAFINKALDAKALDRTVKGGYALKGGDEIGRTLSETVEFLESNKNQDIFLKLKAQIDNKK